MIRQLYAVEREANEADLTVQAHLKLRLEKSKPLLEKFQARLKEMENRVPPKSLLGKAVGYTLTRWDQLSLCLKIWIRSVRQQSC